VKKLPIILGVVVVLALFFPFWGGLVVSDIAAIDDSDLQLSLELPSNNAFDALSQLEEGDALSLLDEAVQADGYLEPSLVELDSFDDFLPGLTSYGDAIEESVEAAKTMDDDLAAEELERSLKVTQMMMDAPGSLIQYLVAHTAKTLLIETILERDLDLDLTPYQDNKSGLILAFKVEYMMQSFAVDFGEDFDTWKDEIHPNRTKKILAEKTREYITLLEVPCEETVALGEPAESQGITTFSGVNALGEMLIYQLSPRADDARSKMCELDDLF